MGDELIKNLDKLHITDLGIIRVQRIMDLPSATIVQWVKSQIQDKNTAIIRRGKNWYVQNKGYVITINATSYTIITVHKA